MGLGKRRENHNHNNKMIYNFTPPYLSSLAPQSVSNLSRYNLRNSNDYMMLLYLQGVTLNMLFVQSLIPKLII